MKKEEVEAFFDACAPGWDADMVRDEKVIAEILDNAGVKPGVSALDVACGTGVLFPDYLSRGVAKLTAIDLSHKMADIAREKFPGVTVLWGDMETYPFEETFDVVMVYNAFPHFPEPEKLLTRLAGLVKPGGRLSIAHGMSREKLLRHHSGRAAAISVELPEAAVLAAMMTPWFDVDVQISDDRMYQVSGVRK